MRLGPMVKRAHSFRSLKVVAKLRVRKRDGTNWDWAGKRCRAAEATGVISPDHSGSMASHVLATMKFIRRDEKKERGRESAHDPDKSSHQNHELNV